MGIANNRHLTIGRYCVLTRSMVKTPNTNNYRLTFVLFDFFNRHAHRDIKSHDQQMTKVLKIIDTLD